ncbi:hypothetical protein AV530_003825 [Patagioenas fasciata monilis]|uniref:Uncharacterized protein n=1 Tax=Patagioenas fasciata monilis TaxID=372326 RepID=A0A1V4KZF6_PATFA|nr:hypothetical protein AV530_003825 [Patagioenas fasciata monilis]
MQSSSCSKNMWQNHCGHELKLLCPASWFSIEDAWLDVVWEGGINLDSDTRYAIFASLDYDNKTIFIVPDNIYKKSNQGANKD